MSFAFRKKYHPTHKGGVQGWEQADISDTLNIFDISESRTPLIIVEKADDIRFRQSELQSREERTV